GLLQVGADLGDGVPAGLLQQGVGQGERYDGLGDHRGRGDGAGVGALVVGGGLLAGGDVDGAQGARNGRDGLQGASHADHLTVGDASLDPAGTVGHAREGGRVPAVLTVLPVHGEDLVMGCGAAAAGG